MDTVTIQQIRDILQQAEQGASVEPQCSAHGEKGGGVTMTDATTVPLLPYFVIRRSYSWTQPEERLYPNCTPQEATASAAACAKWGHIEVWKGEYNGYSGAFVKLWRQ